jgi:hypothetical protein
MRPSRFIPNGQSHIILFDMRVVAFNYGTHSRKGTLAILFFESLNERPNFHC